MGLDFEPEHDIVVVMDPTSGRYVAQCPVCERMFDEARTEHGMFRLVLTHMNDEHRDRVRGHA